MSNSGDLAAILSAVALISVPVLTWLLARKSRKVDETKILDELSQRMFDQMQEERDAKGRENRELREEMSQLRAETRGAITAADRRAQAAEERAEQVRVKYLAELTAINNRVRTVEAKASHYDDEVIQLRRGVMNGTVPPLPERPTFQELS